MTNVICGIESAVPTELIPCPIGPGVETPGYRRVVPTALEPQNEKVAVRSVLVVSKFYHARFSFSLLISFCQPEHYP